jgi:hypothetical protein
VVVSLNGVLIVLPQIPLTRLVEGRNRAAMLSAAAPLTAGLLLSAGGGDAARLTCAVLGAVTAAGFVWLLRGRTPERTRAVAPAPINADATTGAAS